MKDYDRVVVWLDYFNKNLKKSRGRRLSLAKCIFDPSFKELSEAADEAGLAISETNEKARFPRRPYVRSGYISLPKSDRTKSAILNAISAVLVAKRAKARTQKDKKKKKKRKKGKNRGQDK